MLGEGWRPRSSKVRTGLWGPEPVGVGRDSRRRQQDVSAATQATENDDAGSDGGHEGGQCQWPMALLSASTRAVPTARTATPSTSATPARPRHAKSFALLEGLTDDEYDQGKSEAMPAVFIA